MKPKPLKDKIVKMNIEDLYSKFELKNFTYTDVEGAVEWLKRWKLKHSTTEQVCACGKKMHTFFMNPMFNVRCYDCLIKLAFPDLVEKE